MKLFFIVNKKIRKNKKNITQAVRLLEKIGKQILLSIVVFFYIYYEFVIIYIYL